MHQSPLRSLFRSLSVLDDKLWREQNSQLRGAHIRFSEHKPDHLLRASCNRRVELLPSKCSLCEGRALLEEVLLRLHLV